MSIECNGIDYVVDRTVYTDGANNARTLIGAYLDWDHIYSKIRVLKTNLAKA